MTEKFMSSKDRRFLDFYTYYLGAIVIFILIIYFTGNQVIAGTSGIIEGKVTTLAGMVGVYGSTDNIGERASFYHPKDITCLGNNLYIVDTSNSVIRKINIDTAEVTTFVGKTGFITGSFFGAVSGGAEDGIGPKASFRVPQGITTDGINLFVADFGNSTIRKIVVDDRMVTTIAGTVGTTDSVDGVGLNAHFNTPRGITSDGTNLYIADTYSHIIRKITLPNYVVTTIAGLAGKIGSSDGIGKEARFYYPRGITTDGINLYVADSDNNTIRKIIIATGEVTTLAGMPGIAGSSDGRGKTARFSKPYGITIGGNILYVADTLNNAIRKIDIISSLVTTVAGKASEAGSSDGVGNKARFNGPKGIVSCKNVIYVADTYNHTIRKIE